MKPCFFLYFPRSLIPYQWMQRWCFYYGNFVFFRDPLDMWRYIQVGETRLWLKPDNFSLEFSKFLMIFPVFEAALIHRHNPLLCCNTVAPIILTCPSFEVPHQTWMAQLAGSVSCIRNLGKWLGRNMCTKTRPPCKISIEPEKSPLWKGTSSSKPWLFDHFLVPPVNFQVVALY